MMMTEEVELQMRSTQRWEDGLRFEKIVPCCR